MKRIKKIFYLLLMWFLLLNNNIFSYDLNDIIDDKTKQEIEKKTNIKIKTIKDYLKIRFDPSVLNKITNNQYENVKLLPITSKKNIEKFTSIKEEWKYLLVYDSIVDKIIGVVSLYDNVVLPWFIKGTNPSASKTFIDANANLKELLDNIEKEKDNNIIKNIKGTKIFVMNKKIYEDFKTIYWKTYKKIGESANPLELTINFIDWDWNTIKKKIKIYWIYNINNGVAYYVKDWKKIVTNLNYRDDNISNLSIKNSSETENDKPVEPEIQIWLFYDENFVKCLENGGAYDKDWNSIKLSFKDNWDWTWTLISNVDNIVKINCSNNNDTNNDNNITDLRWLENFKNIDILKIPNTENVKVYYPCQAKDVSDYSEFDIYNSNVAEFTNSLYDFYWLAKDSEWNTYYLVREKDATWNTVRWYNWCNWWIFVDKNVPEAGKNWDWYVNNLVNCIDDALKSIWLVKWIDYNLVNYYDKTIKKEFYMFIDYTKKIKNLKSLTCGYPHYVKNIIGIWFLKGLETLSLYGYGRLINGDDIFNLSNLTYLHADLWNLNYNISKLTKLETLESENTILTTDIVLPNSLKKIIIWWLDNLSWNHRIILDKNKDYSIDYFEITGYNQNWTFDLNALNWKFKPKAIIYYYSCSEKPKLLIKNIKTKNLNKFLQNISSNLTYLELIDIDLNWEELDISNLTNLLRLYIVNISNWKIDLSQIWNLVSLEYLRLDWYNKPILKQDTIDLTNNSNLVSNSQTTSIDRIPWLKKLYLPDNIKIRLNNLPNLTNIYFKHKIYFLNTTPYNIPYFDS